MPRDDKSAKKNVRPSVCPTDIFSNLKPISKIFFFPMKDNRKREAKFEDEQNRSVGSKVMAEKVFFSRGKQQERMVGQASFAVGANEGKYERMIGTNEGKL